MKLPSITALLLSLLFPTIHAQDEERIIYRTAHALYPHDTQSLNNYLASEKAALKTYRTHASTARFPACALDGIRELCDLKYPTSMPSRLAELRKQKAAYLVIVEGTWAKQLPADVRVNIEKIGASQHGFDYVKRYAWAVSESLAYLRVKELKIPDKQFSRVQNLWPGSYQSQLKESLGIRPE